MAAIGFPGNFRLTMTRNFLKCTLLGRESKIDSSFETQKGMHDHFTKIAKVYRDLRTTDEEPIHLIRNELTVLERGEHLARRKEIYETIYPESRAFSTERQRRKVVNRAK